MVWQQSEVPVRVIVPIVIVRGFSGWQIRGEGDHVDLLNLFPLFVNPDLEVVHCLLVCVEEEDLAVPLSVPLEPGQAELGAYNDCSCFEECKALSRV